MALGVRGQSQTPPRMTRRLRQKTGADYIIMPLAPQISTLGTA
ncbi:hypothetical protein EDWATA_00915 [Edwardsiella tarda ATCC 23685]|uniref:Uncharacterized protein n=1 Tax=Edwardsiella tarda ATCC 23685 TaxID=500638 RepID=D4F2G5_EDWTA|nr:hypothetical protein EDWATA_00915 [Edwardsiella tarda ATCC 23685]